MTLNATGTTDFNEEDTLDTLTFSWTQTSGPTVTLAGTPTPSFLAADDGTFTFQLTVTDSGGLSDTDTVVVTVNNVAPTIISVVADPTSVKEGETSTINVTATDVAAADIPDLQYSFDCDGNGVFEVGPQAGGSTTCTLPGGQDTVVVGVQVDDQDGGVTRGNVTVTVAVNKPPTAEAGDDQTVDEGETVLFDGTASVDEDGTIDRYEWDFGDDGTGDGATTTHVYADNGTFTVVLRVFDDEGATGDATADVTVSNVAPPVEPSDDQSFDEGGTFSSAGSFDDPGDDTWTATVDYGDGAGAQPLALNPDKTFSLSHLYADDDTFTVIVTVTDDDGGVGSGDLTVTVANIAPVVEPGPGQSAFQDETVTIEFTFTDVGTADTHTATIDWDDGTVEPGDVITEADGSGTVDGTHEYADPGTFTVNVTVTDDDGAVGTGSLGVVILVSAELIEGIEVTNFTVVPETPVPPETVKASFTILNSTVDSILVPGLELLVNGVVETTFEPFELAGGLESSPLDFTITRREPGTYAVQVLNEARTFTIQPPKLTITAVSVTPRLVGPRDTVVISAEARNDGGAVGTFSVDIRVDGSSDVHQIRLPAGVTETVVRFVTIPARPSAAGITSPGAHTVAVGGLRAGYEVARPAIQAPVPVAPPFNPVTTRARDPAGNPLDIDPAGEIRFGGGSITLSIPVRAAAGVAVERFVDTTSGISIIGTDVVVPVKDPDTGEGLLGEGNAATGTFEFLDLVTEERRTDLSADDPRVGRLGVSLKAGLEELPEGVSIEATIKKELTAEERTKVELLAREGGKIVANEAGTVTVRTENLDSKTDVSQVTMTMKVSADWVDAYGVENVRIAHVDDEGEVETLVPVCTGPDENNEFTCVAVTDRGLSEFSLLALADVPAEFSARNLVVDPVAVEPGETVKVTIDIFNDGVKAGSFSAILKVKPPGATEFEAIAVKEITLEGGEEGTVRFFVLREEQGDYEVEIEGRKGELSSGSFGVFRKIDPARLTFIDLVILPEEVEPGEPVLISMSVVNEGLDAGRTEIEFRINEVLVEIRSLSIPGRGRTEAVFEFIPPSEGTFTFELIDVEEVVEPLRGQVTAVIALAPAEFILADLDVSPIEVDPGEQVTITFELTNIGELAGEIMVTLLLNGVEVASKDVSLEALVAAPVTFTIPAPEEPGDYTVRTVGAVIEGEPEVLPLEGVFKVLEIEAVGPSRPRTRVSDLDVFPKLVEPGETVKITVVVENVGDVEASRTLTLKVDGVLVGPETVVTLAPGDTETVVFEIVAPEVAGRHDLEIDGIPDFFEVAELAPLIAPARLIQVSPLTVSPQVVQPGQAVSISVTLRNDGDEDGFTDVILRVIRDQVVEIEIVEKDVLVPGRQEAALTFEVSRFEDGQYTVEVEAVAVVGVKVLKEPFVVVSPALANLVVVKESLIVDPEEVISGKPVTISLDVLNKGQVAGRRTVVLRVDGVKIEEKVEFLEPNETKSVSFTLLERGIGTHTVAVDGVTVEFRVTKPAPLALTIPLLVLFALLVAGLALLIYRRATSGAPPPQTV